MAKTSKKTEFLAPDQLKPTKSRISKALLETNGHAEEPKPKGISIPAPNMKVAEFTIQGTSIYVQNRFSAKARELMKATQEAGSTAKKGKKRTPKDFMACYHDAMYRGPKGQYGIPCAAFRNAMISACRTVGFVMTHAKSAVFIEKDFIDATDIGTPLVQITKGEPKYFEATVRNDNGSADIRARPLWEEGWEAQVRVRFDADMLTLEDVSNLLMRAGMQVGIGEGRAGSKDTAGQGWGFFKVSDNVNVQ